MIISALKTLYHRTGPEPFIWLCALLWLALWNPASGSDFTLCPLKNIGFEHCPGCGLGRSVSYFLHGDVASSMKSHVLGIPATLILMFRIVSLLWNPLQQLCSISSLTNHRNPYA